MAANWFILTQLDLGDATTLIFSAPLWTQVMAWQFLGERFGRVEILTMIMGLTGVLFIARPAALGFPHPPELSSDAGNGTEESGVKLGGAVTPCGLPRFVVTIIGVFGAIAGGGANVLVRQLTKVHVLVTVLVLATYGTLLSPIAAFVFQHPRALVGLPEWLFVGGIAALGFVGQVCKTAGLKLEAAGPASMMRLCDLLLAFIFQATLLHRPVHPLSAVGAGLILLTAAIIAVDKFRRSKPTKDPPNKSVEDSARASNIADPPVDMGKFSKGIEIVAHKQNLAI